MTVLTFGKHLCSPCPWRRKICRWWWRWSALYTENTLEIEKNMVWGSRCTNFRCRPISQKMRSTSSRPQFWDSNIWIARSWIRGKTGWYSNAILYNEQHTPQTWETFCPVFW